MWAPGSAEVQNLDIFSDCLKTPTWLDQASKKTCKKDLFYTGFFDKKTWSIFRRQHPTSKKHPSEGFGIAPKKGKPEKRGRKPGTSWNGETRVERMGGISAGVGGGGGSARLYWVPFWNPWGEGRNVQETWHTILDTPYVAFYIPHWTGSTLDFTVYTIESTPLHFILYKLYFTFLALHCTPDTPQEQETMGFSNLSIKYDNDGVP